MLAVAVAVLLFALVAGVFVTVGLALMVGSFAMPGLLPAGAISAGAGMVLLVIALLVVAAFAPVRTFFNALLMLLRVAPDLGGVMQSLAAALLFASQVLESVSQFLNDRVKPIALNTRGALDKMSTTIPAGGVEVPHFDLNEQSLTSYTPVSVPSGFPSDPKVFTGSPDRSPRHVLDVHQEFQTAADSLAHIESDLDAKSRDAHDTSVALHDLSLAITGVFGTAP